MLNDHQLLEAYVRDRSEEAFRELVSRHIDIVYSSALRQLRNPHLAEEATQSAFIALAEKAGSLGQARVIAGWLHRAAHFAALKLQRTEARRRHWEEQAASMNLPNEESGSLNDAALQHIDSALADLKERDRDAVILRFLHRKSLREVGDLLGTTEDAAKKRVGRALDKMRDFLGRRGVSVSGTALAAGLAQMPVSAAPTALAAAATALALQATVSAASGSTLLDLISLNKLKVAVLAAFLLVAATATYLLRFGNSPVFAAASNPAPTNSMKIHIASVLVNDQDRALQFYTEVLGFVKKSDTRTGAGRRLSLASPAELDGAQLLLEPTVFAPARIFQAALFQAGIPITAFMTEDIQKEYERLSALGVVFSMKPTLMGTTTLAMFEDTCGNRIQLFQPPNVIQAAARPGIRIRLNSVMVNNQDRALKFYTEILGFRKKHDIPVGGGRWLTVVSPDSPDEMELTLEPLGFEPAITYQKALFDAGIPLTQLAVSDLAKEHERLRKLGVIFAKEPARSGPVMTAIIEDTCGNLVQLVEQKF